MQNRRPRASKLGESLYCRGGCKRLLFLEHFPADHIGICQTCDDRRGRDSPSGQLQDEHLSQADLPWSTQQQSRNRIAPAQAYVVGESSNSHRRQNPHTLLSSSVTTYSDVGQHPSDRSTYGITKPKRGKRRTAVAPHPDPVRISNTGQLTERRPGEVEGLSGNVQRTTRSLPVRTAYSKAAPPQDAQLVEEDVDAATTQSLAWGPIDSNNQLPEPVQVYKANPAVLDCIDKLIDTWDVEDIVEVFPKDIWPKANTGWSVDILNRVLCIAKEYPDKESRTKITAKFAELCQIRQSRPRSKTQWTVADVTATVAWAKEHCRPSTVSNQVSQGQGAVVDVSLSQRLRKPRLIQRLNKGKQKAG